MSTATTDWQQETRIYDAPHRRLGTMARLLRGLPQRRLLDVGCSTGAMRDLLPADFDYYGCDIADHARGRLGAERFEQIDFNQSCDLSKFAGRQIDVVHIGGVLEYLREPEQLIASLKGLLPPAGAMVVSIINFQAASYQRAGSHHPWWVYKPTLDELRAMLTAEGWRIERQIPFVGKPGLRNWTRQRLTHLLGVDHAWTRRNARQFVLVAKS